MKEKIALVFDLAVSSGSVDLWRGESRLGHIDIGERKASSDHILPVIRELLDLSEAGISEIGEVVCTRGPGGYTGIRVGIAIARGLAKALQTDSFGYTVYDVLLSAVPDNEKAVAVLDAGRSEYLVTERGGEGLRHTTVGEDRLAEILGAYASERAILVTRKHLAFIQTSGISETDFVDASDNVTELLYRYHLLRHGEGSSLVPVYGRELVNDGKNG